VRRGHAEPLHAEFWLSAVARGCRKATEDAEFARIAGSAFGGMEVRPLSILSQIWIALVELVGSAGARLPLEWLSGRPARLNAWLSDTAAWYEGWWRSALDDPLWHAAWTADAAQWTRLVERLTAQRSEGLRALARFE
jgi:hypothetical protein